MLPPNASATLAFELTPEGRTLVTDDGRRVTPAGGYNVTCEAGGLARVSAGLRVAG